MTNATSTALITGGSKGLGRELALQLSERGWEVFITGRNAASLQSASEQLPRGVHARQGDVTDPRHLEQLTTELAGRLDVVINNASDLGHSPLRTVANTDLDAVRRAVEVNLLAPWALTHALLPTLRERQGIVVNISSDAAVEPYPTWGAYGASKAALDHFTAILAAEEPDLSVYAFDPGDMRTDLHQAAFPGEDISDRPLPQAAARSLVGILEGRPPGGRYTIESPVGAVA